MSTIEFLTAGRRIWQTDSPYSGNQLVTRGNSVATGPHGTFYLAMSSITMDSKKCNRQMIDAVLK
jgi:hypothetical protein